MTDRQTQATRLYDLWVSTEQRIARYESQARQERAYRDAIVKQLHDLGWSYRRIGEAVGLSHSRVQQMVTTAKEPS